jgi:hypothetical protein
MRGYRLLPCRTPYTADGKGRLGVHQTWEASSVVPGRLSRRSEKPDSVGTCGGITLG